MTINCLLVNDYERFTHHHSKKKASQQKRLLSLIIMGNNDAGILPSHFSFSYWRQQVLLTTFLQWLSFEGDG